MGENQVNQSLKVFGFSTLIVILVLIQGCGTTQPVSSTNTSNTVDELSDKQKAVRDYVQLGNNYLGQGNRKQARFNYLKAISLDPTSPPANNGVALLYQSEGEWKLAEKHYRKAITEDTSFTGARNNYARFLVLQERYDEARQQYEIAVKDINYNLRPQAFVGLSVAQFYLNDLSLSYLE